MPQLDLTLKILVVDDMPAMRSIVRNMLEEMGFTRIVEAENGEVAWQLVQDSVASEPFGLVIADWNMPTMSGAELLRAVRSLALTREIPFFIVTGQGNQAHLAEAVHAGVTDYVVKPFSAEQLVEKIRALFGT